MLLNGARRVLILSPHTDDAELGCGGTIAKLATEKKDLYYAVFSSCEESVPAGSPKDVLVQEMRRATKLLGISPKNLHIFSHPVRHFAEHRQTILDQIIHLRETLHPEVVFTPSTYDIHQDHEVITKEALRAFKSSATLFAYEEPWNTFHAFHKRSVVPRSNYFVPLEKRYLIRKVNALQAYRSQRRRTYMSPDFIYALARVRGAPIAVPYAEAFEVLRGIAKDR